MSFASTDDFLFHARRRYLCVRCCCCSRCLRNIRGRDTDVFSSSFFLENKLKDFIYIYVFNNGFRRCKNNIICCTHGAVVIIPSFPTLSAPVYYVSDEIIIYLYTGHWCTYSTQIVVLFFLRAMYHKR